MGEDQTLASLCEPGTACPKTDRYPVEFRTLNPQTRTSQSGVTLSKAKHHIVAFTDGL
jgi:hypothetical protein